MTNLFDIGDKVRNVISGDIGTIIYSPKGVQVIGSNADGTEFKTGGCKAEVMAEYWEVLRNG